jgi:hypothetical protein
MNSHSNAIALLSDLVNQLREKLPRIDCDNAADLIAHHEFGVALELLCEQFIEHDIVLACEDIDSLQESAIAIGMVDSMARWRTQFLTT